MVSEIREALTKEAVYEQRLKRGKGTSTKSAGIADRGPRQRPKHRHVLLVEEKQGHCGENEVKREEL